MKYLVRKALKNKIMVSDETILKSELMDEYINFDKLKEDEIVKLLDYYLMEKYPVRFERDININIITGLYKKSLQERFDLKKELSKGNFIVNWIVPIVDDVKYNFNKNMEDNTLNISITEFEQQITDYKKSFTNQNDTEKLITAFSGYKNNLEGLNGINMVILNNREVFSYNYGEHRNVFEQEILKVIGLRIDREHFQDYNYLIRNYTSHIRDDTMKLKVKFQDNFKDEYFFNNRDEYDSVLEILNNIYQDYHVVLSNLFAELQKDVLSYYKTKSEDDKSRKYVIPFDDKEHRTEVIKNNIIKDLYLKYYYSGKNTDSNLANAYWLYKNIDEGMNFYIISKFIEEKIDLKKVEDVNKKFSDEILKHYSELLSANISLISRNKLLTNYLKENIQRNLDTNNKIAKLHWSLIQIFGENKYLGLLKESKLKNISITELLSKKEMEIYEDFMKSYEKKIKISENECDFDSLRQYLDSIPQYDIKKKSKIFDKLLETYAEKDGKGNLKLPEESSKDYIIYPEKKCDDKNKILGCYHEVILYKLLPSISDKKEIDRLNKLIEENFEENDEDYNQYICKYCKRYIRMNLGINEEITYDNDQGVMKSGNDTRNEVSLLNKMSEYLFTIGRNDFNPRDLVEEIIELVDKEILKEVNTKNFELKRELIQISYIISIIINKILISTNKYLNTSIHPVVNYTKEELINYFIKITEKINYSLFKKLKEYKLDLYRIILNRLNTVSDTIQHFAFYNKKLKKSLKENLDYTNKIKDMEINDKYEKLINKKEGSREIQLNSLMDLIVYLENKYMHIYQNEFYKPKVQNVHTISLDRKKLEKVNEFNIYGIDTKIEELLEVKELIEKLKKIYNNEINGKYERKMITGRNYVVPEINEKYISKIDIRKNIIDFFILRALDGTTQEFTYQGYSLIDGRDIESISNPSDKEFAIMEKKYNELKSEDKKDVKEIFTYEYKPIKLSDKYKNLVDINEKNIVNLVEKVISKVFKLEMSSASSESEREESLKEAGFNSKDFIQFLMQLGYYVNQKKEYQVKITDKKKLERIEKENDKQRKELLKKYIIDLIILINLLKNKDNLITVKNFMGYQEYEKYFDIEKDFAKIKVEYSIDDINNIGRIVDITDKKKGNILLNILINLIGDNTGISMKLNKFFTEFLFKLYYSYNYYDVTQNEKDNLNKNNEVDIFNTIKKINNITDEDRIDLDIDFIDLRKVSDPTKFEEIIKRVENNRNQMHDELMMDGEEGFNDEEFEVGEVDL